MGDSTRGRLQLGLRARPGLVGLQSDFAFHHVKDEFDLGAFAEAWAGLRKGETRWSKDYGILGGLQLRW